MKMDIRFAVVGIALSLLAGCNRGSDLSCLKGHGSDASSEARAAAAKGDLGFYYYVRGGGAAMRTPGVQTDLPVDGKGPVLKPIGDQPFRPSPAADASAPMTDCEHRMVEWARRYNRALCPLASARGTRCTIIDDDRLRDF